MSDYFGATTLFGSTGNLGNDSCRRNKNFVTGYTCPGSGSRTVEELTAYIKQGLGASNFRLALYTTALARVCQGAAELQPTGSYGWQGHIGQANISPNPVTITGGVQYFIAITYDGSGSAYQTIYLEIGASGDASYINTDYTAGFPDPLGAGTDTTPKYNLRCGVQEVGGGGLPIPVAMHHYKQQGVS